MTGFTDGQTIRLSGDMVEIVCAVSSKPSSRIASRALSEDTEMLPSLVHKLHAVLDLWPLNVDRL